MKHKPKLNGIKVILRPFTKEDVESMLMILNDPEIIKLTGSADTTEKTHIPLNEDQIKYTTKWYEKINSHDDRLDLAIEYKGKLAGEVVLNEYDEDLKTCNFRILIGKEYRDKGLGSDAIKTFLDYAFNSLDLHRIELEVIAFNPRARHVYEKCGFVYEGTKRKAHRFDDEWIDINLMSILKEDNQ